MILVTGGAGFIGANFILGWIAERNPEVVKRIAQYGHEIASHGYSHQGLDQLTPESFGQDLKRSLEILKQITGKKINGFTPQQRFFLSWAQVWRSNTLPESEAQLVKTDPHSPGMYRTNGPVSNIDAWYAAFDVTPREKMYKPESERIHIW